MPHPDRSGEPFPVHRPAPRSAALDLLGKAPRALRSYGLGGVVRRAVRVAYQRLDVAGLDEPLRPDDIADSRGLRLPVPAHPRPSGQPLTIGWVTTPPALGSGGHTTMFRMVQALEHAGHRCVLFLHDPFGGDSAAQSATIRHGWPEVKAEIRSVAAGLRSLDACVATSWPTAHVLARHGTAPMHRFYFVQDFEPFFYPRGSEYALAEDTYRMGLECIALGRMVGDMLASIGVLAHVVPFGCDTDVYRLLEPPTRRSGLVFYTRPGVGRRGYLLGRLALQAFHQRHPEQDIHVYGAAARGMGIPVTRHSRTSPSGLNVLYNQTLGGLALSFTNISLVAEEMLAAGCVPVVNDSVYARADLPNPHAIWAEPTPLGIADALCALVEERESAQRAAAAAASVVGRSWHASQHEVVSIIQDRVSGMRI
jgi:O-antigen biosynthesis protein